MKPVESATGTEKEQLEQMSRGRRQTPRGYSTLSDVEETGTHGGLRIQMSACWDRGKQENKGTWTMKDNTKCERRIHGSEDSTGHEQVKELVDAMGDEVL